MGNRKVIGVHNEKPFSFSVSELLGQILPLRRSMPKPVPTTADFFLFIAGHGQNSFANRQWSRLRSISFRRCPSKVYRVVLSEPVTTTICLSISRVANTPISGHPVSAVPVVRKIQE